MRFFKINGISGFEGLEMVHGGALKGSRVRFVSALEGL